ncbi:MAG: radical SAM protein [Desulfobacteraceae bacterium]|nr:MAG: radical SAM protein [Desulfobacteraceae bacterium]
MPESKTEKSLIIPVFIPHSGCPHQCAFCNQAALTGASTRLPDRKAIASITDQYLSYARAPKHAELAFFGGNFLGLPSFEIKRLLEDAGGLIETGRIESIRFSTRPDTISPETLALIRPYPVSLVEIGAQSMDDQVLHAALRGHSAEDTIRAVHLLRQNGVAHGLQMMIGMMGDTPETALKSARDMAALRPSTMRIYPLVVLKKSPMALWYETGTYIPMSLSESVSLSADIYSIFHQQGIPVIRMGLQASDLMEDKTQVIAGPWHPAFGHLVYSELMFRLVCKQLDQYVSSRDAVYETVTDQSKKGLKNLGNKGKAAPEVIELRVNPASRSRLHGDKNANLTRLSDRYPQVQWKIVPDKKVHTDSVTVCKG